MVLKLHEIFSDRIFQILTWRSFPPVPRSVLRASRALDARMSLPFVGPPGAPSGKYVDVVVRVVQLVVMLVVESVPLPHPTQTTAQCLGYIGYGGSLRSNPVRIRQGPDAGGRGRVADVGL